MMKVGTEQMKELQKAKNVEEIKKLTKKRTEEGLPEMPPEELTAMEKFDAGLITVGPCMVHTRPLSKKEQEVEQEKVRFAQIEENKKTLRELQKTRDETNLPPDALKTYNEGIEAFVKGCDLGKGLGKGL